MIIIRLCTLAGVVLSASFLLVAEYQADTTTRSATSQSADGDRVAQNDDSDNAQAQAPAATPDTGAGDDSNGPADDSKSPPQDQE
jgi:predicted lipid-binding transport protein (Tim44 family)